MLERKRKRVLAVVLPLSFLVLVALSYLIYAVGIPLHAFISSANSGPSLGVSTRLTAPNTKELLANVNSERIKNNLQPLMINEKLNQSACKKADDMIARGYWSHDAPDGTQPWYWMEQVGYSYQRAGENLAYGMPDAKTTVQKWMMSEGHKRNILDADFNEMGMCVRVGDYQGRHGQSLIVNHFGKPL